MKRKLINSALSIFFILLFSGCIWSDPIESGLKEDTERFGMQASKEDIRQFTDSLFNISALDSVVATDIFKPGKLFFAFHTNGCDDCIKRNLDYLKDSPYKDKLIIIAQSDNIRNIQILINHYQLNGVPIYSMNNIDNFPIMAIRLGKPIYFTFDENYKTNSLEIVNFNFPKTTIKYLENLNL